jgi:hypothetical protein
MDDEMRDVKLGDTVWTIESKEINNHDSCELCESVGSFIHKETRIECPKCSGYGTISKPSHFIYAALGPFTLGQIQVTRKSEFDRWEMQHLEKKLYQVNNGWTRVPDGWEERKYMFKETGIGSGTIHTHVFFTEKEAQRFADELNKERGETE